MTVVLRSPHWAGNARIQKAANNNPPISKGDPDRVAVTLLQQALITCGFPMKAGADGIFGSQTAAAIVDVEKKFGFGVDAGIAGREVCGALDLALRGWDPPSGPHWGGQLALTVVPLAQRKIARAISALSDFQALVVAGNLSTAGAVTLAALKTHFKLVPSGSSKLTREEFITRQNIDFVLSNFRKIRQTIGNAKMLHHSICTLGLETAAEAPFGGPVIFGPPYADFRLAPVAETNIDKTGPNSLAAMMMHESTHVIDNQSGSDVAHISEFTTAYETQLATNARHNPSAYATFAAHIDEQKDRPRSRRYGLGAGRPL